MPPNTAVCRVCLVVDVRMHTIAGTPLQQVFENLTKTSLHTADKRSVAACYVCYGLLLKCCKLMRMAAKSDSVLTTIFEKCSKITVRSISMIDREANGLYAVVPLTNSGVEYFDNIPPPVKVEDTEIETGVDKVDNIEIKQEILRDTLESPLSPSNVDKICPVGQQTASTANQEIYVKKEIQEDNNPVTLKPTEETSTNKKRHEPPEDLRNGEKPYKCNVCKLKSFRFKSHLLTHTKACRNKTFDCYICQKLFKCDKTLQNHTKTHTDETPYKCSVCQCSFKFLGNLQRHSKSMHTSEANVFECDTCQRKFPRKDYLANHLRLHISDKPYQCNVCQKQFGDRSNYRRHLKKHNNANDVKQFECNICECRFTHKQHLQVHIRKHSGEKPYACAHCPLRFSHQSHLKTHTRTHTGEKPYWCDVCPRRFNRRTHLLSHAKVHNKENLTI